MKRLGEAVWAAMRDEYVTGNESYAEIGARYGANKKLVESHALNRSQNDGRTWGELRAAFLDDVERKTVQKTGDGIAKTLARVREKAASVAEKALLRIETKLDDETPIEDKDLIQMAKLATSIKLEIGGDPNGAPVDIRTSLDALTIEELRKLAEDS